MVASNAATNLATNLASNTAGGALTIPQILGASLLADWDSRVTCTGAAWVEAIGGRSISGAGHTPTVATDGALFNGIVTAQTDGAATYYEGGALSPVLAINGTRPWICIVMRVKTLPGAAKTGVSFFNSGFGANPRLETKPDATGLIGVINGSVVSTAASVTAAPSIYEELLDSTGVQRFLRDGVELGNAGTGVTMSANFDWLSVGNLSFAGDFSSVSVARILVATPTPSAAQLTAVRAILKALYATP